MHGDVAKAAMWLAIGMVLSTLILMVGTFCIVHGDWLLAHRDFGAAYQAAPVAPAASN